MVTGMPVGKIEVTERDEGGKRNQGIDGFESEGANPLDNKGAHRDTGTNNVRSPERKPPEKNHSLIFHNHCL
jgi:hypothetical protein